MSGQSKMLILYNSKGVDPKHIEWSEVFFENLKISLGQLQDLSSLSLMDFSADANEIGLAKALIFIINQQDIDTPSSLQSLNKTISSIKPLQLCYLLLPEAIDPNNLPDFLQYKTVYNFFDLDSDTGFTRKYHPTGNFDSSKLYWSKILDIAYDLNVGILANQNSKPDKCIYLATTTPDQYENYDALRSELIHRGFKIFPDHILYGNYNELSKLIIEYIKKSFMSIHIIGNSYGEIVPDSDFSLTDMQFRLASKRTNNIKLNDKNSPFQRLLWLQPALKPSNERQRSFINSLRIEEKNEFTEIIQIPIEEFKADLRERITSFNSAISVDINENGFKKSVYLIYEQKNLKPVQELSRFLENQGIKILNIDYSKISENIVSTHYQYLTKASAVIICDFESQRQWIISKMKDLIKAPGYGRELPFEAKAILTNKTTRYSNLVEGSDNLLLDANQDLATTLKPFILKLKLK